MATAATILSKEQLLCPICLDVFNQPVSTPCGHNFCRDCIQTYWRSATLPQCPMCKQKLNKRPDLKVNTFISEVTSQFKKFWEKKYKDGSETMDPPISSKGEVSCDVCVGKQVKAFKSCLDCLASFCKTHLEPHHVVASLKNHRLINATMSMQDRVCKKHQSLLELFCHTDQKYVCQVCTQKDHKTHLTVHIDNESKNRRAQIGNLTAEVQGMIHNLLQKICELNKNVQLSKRNTEKELEESLQIFNKLLQIVQRGQAEVAEVIKARQRQVESRDSGMIMELEQEIDQLRHINTELNLLSSTNDDLYLLQNFPALSTVTAITDWCETWGQSVEYVGTVRRAVRRVACQVEETVKAEAKKLCEAEFKRAKSCAVDVTLDLDTAHPKLVLSENKKQVYHGDVAASCPDIPKRFYPCVSVLAKEGFSFGRFYYEVQVKGKTEWDIGVALESINRKGGNMLNPGRGYWTVGLRKDGNYWALNSPPIHVPLVEKPQRIGVYVDVEGGQVSFYNTDTRSHIYTFIGYTFSERLFPYFNPRRNHDGVNLAPLVILPLAAELPRRSLSPVLRAVVWTLLSCGILSAFCFLFFTLRFKNNRIVKMSSPNLNVLTLFGSVLAYISGFLFAFDEQAYTQTGTSIAVLQARTWTLCLGSTLVFGPILGKTWRLYRVFTQRAPDKRVIIRDIQLIGMVGLLILVDILVLTAWNFSDPIRCSRSVGAFVKVLEKDVSYSLSQLDSCSSEHSNIWIIMIAVQKGCLLLYGTYLAGLTSNVSHPPVNQSPTIITAVTLVTFSSAVAIPVSVFLQAWPNLVYSTVAGAIFICTLAINCMLFVPQLTQWKQFEEDQNNQSQMAKYFSSPSKSQASVYSQDEIYYLLGENSSMKKLLSEKNAAIDSLQEQVNNAKEKLLRLMTASQSLEDQDMDSSATLLNSSSTKSTELQSESPSSSCLTQRETKSRLSARLLSHSLPLPPVSSNMVTSSFNSSSAPNPIIPLPVSPTITEDIHISETQREVSVSGHADRDTAPSRENEELKRPVSLTFPGRTAEETVHFITSLQNRRRLNSAHRGTFLNHSDLTLQVEPNAKLTGFVSSEQLQEILQELSMDAVSETTLRSPAQAVRTPSQLKLTPLSPCSPHPPVPVPCEYPSISPYSMRKRRPPFNSSRRGLHPSCFYTGSVGPNCRKTNANWDHQNPGMSTVNETLLHFHDNNHEVKKENEEKAAAQDEQEAIETCERCFSRSEVEEGGNGEQRRHHIRDSSGYWDSDSSSSTDYCYYHRPYCDSCLQRGSLLCSDSSSDSSDSEYDDCANLYHSSSRPVVFKDNIKPTLV